MNEQDYTYGANNDANENHCGVAQFGILGLNVGTILKGRKASGSFSSLLHETGVVYS